MRAHPLPRALVAVIAMAAIVGVSPAWGGLIVPCADCSTLPALLTLGGRTATGEADPQVAYSVEIRLIDMRPAAGSVVTLDFSNCPRVRLCASQPDPALYTQYLCGSNFVSKVTDVNGRATFTLVGSGGGLPWADCAVYRCARIYADGFLMKDVTMVTPDLDGSGGVTPGDLAIWLELYFSGSDCSLGDYDGSGGLGPNDLSRWLEFHFAGNSVESCAVTSCP